LKKLVITAIAIIIFISSIIVLLNFFANKADEKRYKEINESANEAALWYLKASNEIDVEREGIEENYIPFSFLISQGYLKRKDIVDINNINNCDGYITYKIENKEVTCINTFIKCKNYETENYKDNTVEQFTCK
jgi:hypothetical protein